MRRRFIQVASGDLIEISNELDLDPPLAPMVICDIDGYTSPVTGLPVEGRRARREDLLRTGSRPWEGREQEFKEAARQEQYAEERSTVKAADAAARAFYAMHPEKRELLQHADGGLSDRQARRLTEKYGRR